MLNAMRKGVNSWAHQLLLVMLVVSFGVWGVWDSVTPAEKRSVVEVNGEGISVRDFARAYDQRINTIRIYNPSFDKKMAEMFNIKGSVLSQLVQEKLLMQLAREMHLTLDPDRLREDLASDKAFQKDGKFDMERYRLVLRRNRMTPAEYEQQHIQDTMQRHMLSAVSLLSSLPQALVKDLFFLENEQRMITEVTLKAKDFEADVEVNDTKLEAYLRKNSDQYRTEPEVQVEYLLLNEESVKDQVKIGEEEIANYYQENLDEYIERQERRRARHILISKDKGTETADRQILEAKKRIEAGESFADVAKALSNDEVTGKEGGDLGFFGRGMMTKAFEEAVFSMKKGDMVGPIHTEFGSHLIYLDDIEPEKRKTLADVREKIKTEIFKQQAEELQHQHSIIFEEQIFASEDFAAVTEDLKLIHKKSEFLSRGSDKRTGIEKESKFLDTAFSLGLNELSSLLEFDNGQFVVLKVLERKESRPFELKEVRERVEKAYRQQEADRIIREQVEALLKQLKEKPELWKNPQSVEPKAKVVVSKPFKLKGQQREPSAAVKKAAFELTMKKNIYPRAVENGRNFSLIRLEQIKATDEKALAKAAQKFTQELEQQQRAEHFSALLDTLQKRSQIVQYDKILQQF
ncbi:SurA N-terminal domain-containing protein [Magnetococcales bacterium HHB-1]